LFDNIKKVLDSLIDEFKNNTIPEAISISKFPSIIVPSNSWSLMNQIIQIIHKTKDSRGFRQWVNSKRHVKKGSKAFQILVPCFKKDKDKNETLAYFTTGNVFKVEDTEGEPLDYELLKLPDLPLLEKAKEWGITVEAIGGNISAMGYYKPSAKIIALATPHEKTFLHELMHVSDEKCQGSLKTKQDPIQEIVAELGAAALCRMVGKDPQDSTGNSYQYIEAYAKEINLTPHSACLKVLSRVDKALKLILKGGENESFRLVNNGTASL
jgi:antirestriction protein ArdC